MASAEGVNGVQANSDGRVGDRQKMKEREGGEGGTEKKKIKIKRERKGERGRGKEPEREGAQGVIERRSGQEQPVSEKLFVCHRISVLPEAHVIFPTTEV